MKEITEPEMLHRAAAYCSAAERCIQDVQKKIDAAGRRNESRNPLECLIQIFKVTDCDD